MTEVTLSPDGELRVSKRPAEITVHNAPDRTLINLGVLANFDRQIAWVHDDLIYIGPVVYRVVGWDTQARALQVVRDRDQENA